MDKDMDVEPSALDRAKVYLGPFLADEGLSGQLLGKQAGAVYDAAVAAIAALDHITEEKREEPSEAISIPREAYDFLMGEGPLDGVWFGDIHKGLPGAFWWRGLLKAAAGWPEPPAMRAAAPLVEKAKASPPAGI